MDSLLTLLIGPAAYLTPRGFCLSLDPIFGAISQAGDILTFAAYTAIPILFIAFARRRWHDLASYRQAMLWFAAFVLFCGITHLLHVAGAWLPVDRPAAVMAMLTGLVSIRTAFLLRPLLRAAQRLPAPDQLQAANAQLQTALERARTANEALRESEDRHRASFEASPVPLLLLGRDGKILDCSPSFEGLLGHERAAVRGEMWRHYMTAECAAASADSDWESLLSGRAIHSLPRVLRHKSGALVHVEVSKTLRRSIDGEESVVAVVVDVTERHQTAERLRQTDEALRHRQKMEVMGRVTGGVAHDVNNMLQAIGGNLSLLATRLSEGATGARLTRPIDNALAATARGGTLVTRLLTFARRRRLDPLPLDPRQLVRDMMPLVEMAIGKDGQIEIAHDFSTGTGWCRADGNELEQAIINLATNARDAIADAGGVGRITIATRRVWLQDTGGPDRPPAGDYVRISVIDDGPGLKPEIADDPFEPFATTKEEGKGTGLGLAMVQGFARQSGGMATIANRDCGGVEAAILLPRLPEAEQPQRDYGIKQPEPPAARGRGETLLVVEDDPAVRETLVEQLTELGYHVEEATTAPEALARLEFVGMAPPAAVLTDKVMPGEFDGLELCNRVRAGWPHLPIILMTGTLQRDHVLPEGVEFMPKPYPSGDLARLLRLLLERRRVGA